MNDGLLRQDQALSGLGRSTRKKSPSMLVSMSTIWQQEDEKVIQVIGLVLL